MAEASMMEPSQSQLPARQAILSSLEAFLKHLMDIATVRHNRRLDRKDIVRALIRSYQKNGKPVPISEMKLKGDPKADRLLICRAVKEVSLDYTYSHRRGEIEEDNYLSIEFRVYERSIIVVPYRKKAHEIARERAQTLSLRVPLTKILQKQLDAVRSSLESRTGKRYTSEEAAEWVLLKAIMNEPTEE